MSYSSRESNLERLFSLLMRGFSGDGGNRTRELFPPNNCVLWTGARNSKGYGCRTVGGKPLLAHRAAYIEAFGEIPAGAQIHHICKNRLCVNPEHLEPLLAVDHNRTHLVGVSAGQLIEAAFGERNEVTRRDLVAAGAPHGVSANAISTALNRASGITRVAHGVYRIAEGSAAS